MTMGYRNLRHIYVFLPLLSPCLRFGAPVDGSLHQLQLCSSLDSLCAFGEGSRLVLLGPELEVGCALVDLPLRCLPDSAVLASDAGVSILAFPFTSDVGLVSALLLPFAC